MTDESRPGSVPSRGVPQGSVPQDTGPAAQATPGGSSLGLHLAPGARPVADYELIELLGPGGFGEVWKARGPGSFRVALKFVRLGWLRKNVAEYAGGNANEEIAAVFVSGSLLVFFVCFVV